MAISADRAELRCRSKAYYVSPVPDPSYRAAMTAPAPRFPMPAPAQQALAGNDKQAMPAIRLAGGSHPCRRSYPAHAAHGLRAPDAVTVRTAYRAVPDPAVSTHNAARIGSGAMEVPSRVTS